MLDPPLDRPIGKVSTSGNTVTCNLAVVPTVLCLDNGSINTYCVPLSPYSSSENTVSLFYTRVTE